jgi:hypothetical protein
VVNATANYGAPPSIALRLKRFRTPRSQSPTLARRTEHDISALLVSTKSGTSTYHGEAFEFVENDLFNACNPYDKALGRSANLPCAEISLAAISAVRSEYRPRALKLAATGWELSSIADFEIRRQLHLITTPAQAPSITMANLLNMVKNPNIGDFDKSFARQFDNTAFTLPPNDVKGLTQTGVIPDVFNAFNHTQWTNVCNTGPYCCDNSGNQVNFGTVTAGKEGRIMQMRAKLQF